MKNTKILFIISLSLISKPLFADPAILKNDPKRPVAAVSKELGITADQFVNCFNNVNPAPKGQHPSGQRQQDNKSVLLPCLQKVNPNITNEKLDQVMDKYRPEGAN